MVEKEHEKDPEKFPLEMNSGDWNEQYMLFVAGLEKLNEG